MHVKTYRTTQLAVFLSNNPNFILQNIVLRSVRNQALHHDPIA